jgi:hypothetical protein
MRGGKGERLEFADLHVSIPNIVVVVLQEDGTCPISETFVFPIFAVLEALFPVVTANFDLDDFLAIEPVLDVVAIGDNASVVPLPDGLQGFAFWSGDQFVE